MSHLSPSRDRRGGAGSPHGRPSLAVDSVAEIDLGVDSLREELERLSAANQELLNEHGSQPDLQLPSVHDDETTILRRENARLRQRVEELEALAMQRRQPAGADEAWEERQHEYESLLEEKSEAIRILNHRIQELQQVESIDREELLRMKEQLEQDRERMREDEEALMEQARNMEMAMARDRADLARQRSELQRFQQEVAREIELASRDDGLRDRLVNMQRRHETPGKRPSTHAMLPEQPARPGTVANLQRPGTVPAVPQPEQPAPPQEKSGLLRRIFG